MKLVYRALGHERFFLNNYANLILPQTKKKKKKKNLIVFDIIMTWVVNNNFELNVLESENGGSRAPIKSRKGRE